MATTNKLPEGSTWEQFKVENVTQDTTISVTFAPDVNNNDIPDKYEQVTVTSQAGEHGTVTPEKKIITPGEDALFTITPDEGYVVDTITIGDTVYVNDPNFGKALIEDASDITEALNDPDIQELDINAPLAVSAEVQISKPITLDGNGNVITQASTGKTFTMTQDSTVQNMIINSTADNTEWHSSYGLQFYTGTHNVNNVKLSGGNAGIIVNGSTVNLSGTIDVSNNTFGGIEVCKGSASGLTAGVLNIGDATLVNDTEEYLKPTVWIDGNDDSEGIVNGADAMTMVEIPHGDITQKQYYLKAANAKPISAGDVGYDTLAAAIAGAAGSEISLKADVDEGSVSVPAGSTVVIEGNGHTIHGVINLQSGQSQSTHGSVKISNVVFDGQQDTSWAMNLQNQTATAGQSDFAVEFVNCQFKNMTKKALYLTEVKNLTLTDCTFENCATDEMNDPNTYGDYVVDCNLVGVKDVVVSVNGCTFSNNKAQKASIKVTQRGGESDEGATDMPQGITASVQSLTVEGCTFNDTEPSAHIQIGTDNKSAETNPDAENITGQFGQVEISDNTTAAKIFTAYDGKSYDLTTGQTFTRTGAGQPVIQ